MPTKLHTNILKAMNPLQFGLYVKLNALHCHATFMSEFYHLPFTPFEDDKGTGVYKGHKSAITGVVKPYRHTAAVCKQMCGHTDHVQVLGTVHYCNELLAESSEHCGLLLKARKRDPGSPRVLILDLPLTCCVAWKSHLISVPQLPHL